MLDKAPNQPFKFSTNNWLEKNYDSYGMYNTNSQIEFKTTITNKQKILDLIGQLEKNDTYLKKRDRKLQMIQG